MAKVKINSTDYRRFAEAAETAGTSVDEWLAEAGRAQFTKAAYGTSRVTLARSNPLSEIWFATLLDLAGEIPSPQHLAYLNLCQLQTVVDDTALLTAPDGFTRDVIESRLRTPIAEALSRRLNRPVHVAVTLTRPPEAVRPALEV